MSTADGADVVTIVRERIRQRVAALESLVVEERMLRILLAVIEARLPVPDGQSRTRAQQALAAIATAPGARPSQLAANVGVDVTKLYPALRALEERGFAHCSERRWFLGPSARAVHAVVRGDGPE